MGEVKLGFVPAIEAARIMLSLRSTKQSTQVASFVEGNKWQQQDKWESKELNTVHQGHVFIMKVSWL